MRMAMQRHLLIALIVAVGMAAGCLSPHSIACSDGRFCPAGSECDNVHQTCISAAEKAACASHAEGESCTLKMQPGACRGGICKPFYCGDHVRTAGEACEESDLGGQTCVGLHFHGQTTGLSCNADCTFNTSGCSGLCGDGVRTAEEACEGRDLGGQTCVNLHFYGQTTGLSCNDDCTLNTSGCSGFCGDGMIAGPEQCDGVPSFGRVKTCVDYGFDQGFIGCSETCTMATEGCTSFDGWSVGPASLASAQLRSVWGSGEADVYASNVSTLLHWDGTSWSDAVPAIAKSMSASGFFAVWGTGPSDVYFSASTTAGMTVFRWDGSTWTANSAPEAGAPHAMWASGPTDIYLAG